MHDSASWIRPTAVFFLAALACDKGGGTGDSGAGEYAGGEGDYRIVGGARRVEALRRDPQIGIVRFTAQECPFQYEPNPCMDPACLDQGSADCEAAVSTYCMAHGDDPICAMGPGDGGGDPTDGGPTGGETGGVPPGGESGGAPPGGGSCPFGPSFPPCEEPACQANFGSPECQEAVRMYCDTHPGDGACMGGETDGSGPEGDGERPDPISTETPTSLWIKVYEVALSQDAEGCSDPVVVGHSDDPPSMNLSEGPVLFTGEPPPAGTYGCVIITMSDTIRWSTDAGSCEGSHTQDVHREHDGGQAGVEEKMTIYLSTAGAAPGMASALEPPGFLLAEPHIAGPGVVESIFYMDAEDAVAYYEFPTGPECDMQPPTWGFQTIYE